MALKQDTTKCKDDKSLYILTWMKIRDGLSIKNVKVSVLKNTYENVHSFLGSWISSHEVFWFWLFLHYAFLIRMYI